MTDKELFAEYYKIEEIAKLEGVSVATMENRIYAGKNHPPYTGKGKGRLFPKDLYREWKRSQIVKEIGRAS